MRVRRAESPSASATNLRPAIFASAGRWHFSTTRPHPMMANRKAEVAVLKPRMPCYRLSSTGFWIDIPPQRKLRRAGTTTGRKQRGANVTNCNTGKTRRGPEPSLAWTREAKSALVSELSDSTRLHRRAGLLHGQTLAQGRSCAGSPLLLFVVLIVHVDVPDVALVYPSGGDVFDRHPRRQHRMVLIVVAMHAVATDEEQVLDGVGMLPDRSEVRVAAEIGGIGFGHADHVRGNDVFRVDKAQLFELADRQRLHLRIRKAPQLIGFVAEVFESQGDFGRIGRQRRAPVVEYLQPAKPHARVLNINPVVGKQSCAGGGPARRAVDHPAGDDADRDEVAIRQLRRDAAHRLG